MTALPQRQPIASENADAPVETLPGWTYGNAEFHELEKRNLVLANWQVVGHVSELRSAGDYVTLDIAGERGFVMRGEDDALRAFHNVCRHRAAAVVRGDTGNCGHAVRCFYHGWTYGLDGRLKAVPGEASFPGLDKGRFGLKPLEFEVWQGFVFVRFAGSGASVAERFRPYERELASYRCAEMEPLGGRWDVEIAVDWKNVMDNYLEGYHVPVGHPGLFRLFGNNYEVEVQEGNVNRAVGVLRDKESANWSERALSEAAAADAASGCRAGRQLALLHAAAERRLRRLPGVHGLLPHRAAGARPGAAARADLRPARRRPRPARRALAHPPRQRPDAARGRGAGRIRCRPASPPAPTASATSRRRRPACASCTTWCGRRSRSPASRTAPAPGTVAAVNAAMA